MKLSTFISKYFLLISISAFIFGCFFGRMILGCVVEVVDPEDMTGRADVVGSLNFTTYEGPEGSGIVTAVCELPGEVPISGGCLCGTGCPFYFETILEAPAGFGCVCEPAGIDQALIMCLKTESAENVLKANPVRSDAFHDFFVERVKSK